LIVTARIYSVTFQAVAITVSQDLFELTPADDKPVGLLGLFLGNSTDFKDAEDENLRWSVIRGFTTSGSGGTAPTPRPQGRTDAAAGFTAEVNNTTKATTGTTHVLHADAFNVRAGLAHFWTPETVPQASQADTTIVVRLEAAPVDSITFDGTLYVAEWG
jgi:hypothetical protein